MRSKACFADIHVAIVHLCFVFCIEFKSTQLTNCGARLAICLDCLLRPSEYISKMDTIRRQNLNEQLLHCISSEHTIQATNTLLTTKRCIECSLIAKLI